MVSVQSAGCAPIVKAFDEQQLASEPWKNAATIAAGLRVPKAYGDYLLLDVIRQSRGTAVAVTDDEMLAAVREWARDEGVFAAPEGAASLAAYHKLRRQGFLKTSDRVVLFNTGSGLKYIDVFAAEQKSQLPPSRNIGGIIGPY
jgi:threonine synthase